MDSNAGDETYRVPEGWRPEQTQSGQPPEVAGGREVASAERPPPARIMVIIPFHNRKRVAELCVPTISDTLTSADYLVCCNDGSTEYGREFLEKWADRVCNTVTPVGIEMQRRSHFAMYWQYQHAYTHLYLTDPDAIHDPDWRSHALELQAKAMGAPVCLYNTAAHERLVGNTIATDTENGIIWRRVAPGISYLLTLAHVEKIMPWLSQIRSFDWDIPRILGHRCIISRVSYVEHIGHGGLHHKDEYGIEGGDRALSPTPYLAAKRADVIESLRKRT